MSNIVLYREANRLRNQADLIILKNVMLRRLGDLFFILSDSFTAMRKAVEQTTEKINAITNQWKKIPMWKRICLRISFLIKQK